MCNKFIFLFIINKVYMSYYNYNPTPTRVWSRVENPYVYNNVNNTTNSDVYVPLISENITQEQADYLEKQIYKGNILQYKGNSANLTKSQKYSQLAKGSGPNRTKTFATQSQTYTNPNTNGFLRSNYKSYNENDIVSAPNNVSGPFQYNVNNPDKCSDSSLIKDGGTLISGTYENPCTGQLIIKDDNPNIFNPSSASDVPGNEPLYWNNNVQIWNPRKRYTMSSSGTKWPMNFKGIKSALSPNMNPPPIIKLSLITNNIIQLTWNMYYIYPMNSFSIYVNGIFIKNIPNDGTYTYDLKVSEIENAINSSTKSLETNGFENNSEPNLLKLLVLKSNDLTSLKMLVSKNNDFSIPDRLFYINYTSILNNNESPYSNTLKIDMTPYDPPDVSGCVDTSCNSCCNNCCNSCCNNHCNNNDNKLNEIISLIKDGNTNILNKINTVNTVLTDISSGIIDITNIVTDISYALLDFSNNIIIDTSNNSAIIDLLYDISNNINNNTNNLINDLSNNIINLIKDLSNNITNGDNNIINLITDISSGLIEISNDISYNLLQMRIEIKEKLDTINSTAIEIISKTNTILEKIMKCGCCDGSDNPINSSCNCTLYNSLFTNSTIVKINSYVLQYISIACNNIDDNVFVEISIDEFNSLKFGLDSLEMIFDGNECCFKNIIDIYRNIITIVKNAFDDRNKRRAIIVVSEQWKEDSIILRDKDLLQKYLDSLNKNFTLISAQIISDALILKPEYIIYHNRYGIPCNLDYDSVLLKQIYDDLGIVPLTY